jgi:2-oxoglutarate ferredoxin oxidoreductase subunit gamma
LKLEVRIGGLGGQGVVLAGQILGRAAAYDGKNAVQTQSYGAEARGSLAKSEVIISDSKIGFPVIRKCDVLVAMNQEALATYLKDLKDNGTLIVDSIHEKDALTAKAKVFKIPATETAEKMFGSRVYANMLILGALTEATNIVSETAMEKAIEDATTVEFANTNKQACRKGRELVQQTSASLSRTRQS